MAVTQEFREGWLEMQEEYGRKIDVGSIQVMEAGEIDATVSLPAVKFKKKYDPTPGAKNEFKEYRHVPMDTFMQPIQGAVDRVVGQGDEAERQGNYAKQQGDYAKQQGDYAEEEVRYAENVNADLTGLVVTITDRYGVSRSVDIGFEMFATYGSVAEMKADAANVPQGKFVIIATEDPTSEENAKMYCRTKAPATDTENAFRFLSDLDQASSSAFADWLNNYKPVIEADHTRAEGDHTRAEGDHTRAETDHTRAESDHTTFESDHATSEAQQATFEADEAARQHVFDTGEAQRQDTFDANEEARDDIFKNNEQERISAMTVTRCFVRLQTMRLMFVQPASDSTQYKLRRGRLKIISSYNI